MGKTPAPPPPPDPNATAAAQTASNVKTATTTQQLNMVDQNNPYGSSKYTQVGKWEDGTPKFQQDVTLSPEERRNQQQQWEYDDIVNTLGINQGKKLTGHLDTPFKLDNAATESRLMELGQKRLNPALTSRREQLETQLYNQGAMPGTPAYEEAMARNAESENDAYVQLLLGGRDQANKELLTERNQPINEITALMSGGQVNQPEFGSTPSTQVAGTDIAGLTMDAYKMGPLAQYQAKAANKQAMMDGLFRVGGAALGGWARSDRRLKTNAKRIGMRPDGLPVYSYKYRDDDRMHIGLMADDVEAINPAAVRVVAGYKQVNYDMMAAA